MDDLLALFGLGRALALTVALGVSIAALFTAPIAAHTPASAGRMSVPSAQAASTSLPSR